MFDEILSLLEKSGLPPMIIYSLPILFMIGTSITVFRHYILYRDRKPSRELSRIAWRCAREISKLSREKKALDERLELTQQEIGFVNARVKDELAKFDVKYPGWRKSEGYE